MNVEMIQETTETFTCPTPLSFKRNGTVTLPYNEDSIQNDEDHKGEFYAASIRKGPFMSVQEDRVSSSFELSFSFVVFIANLFSKIVCC